MPEMAIDASKGEVIGDMKRKDGDWVREDAHLDGQENLVLRTKKDGNRSTFGAIRTYSKFEPFQNASSRTPR